MAHITFLFPGLAGGGGDRTALKTAGEPAAQGRRVVILLFRPPLARIPAVRGGTEK